MNALRSAAEREILPDESACFRCSRRAVFGKLNRSHQLNRDSRSSSTRDAADDVHVVGQEFQAEGAPVGRHRADLVVCWMLDYFGRNYVNRPHTGSSAA
ncbi:hypothetical protein GJ496_009153 [Pomphorhynchus laevis]|nr:hypothetical protein GJ496_009153 [Pomphorhynchus laevis]